MAEKSESSSLIDTTPESFSTPACDADESGSSILPISESESQSETSTFKTGVANEASLMKNSTSIEEATPVAKSQDSFNILDEAMEKAVGKMAADSPQGVIDLGSKPTEEEAVTDEMEPLIKRRHASMREPDKRFDYADNVLGSVQMPPGTKAYKEESILYVMGYSKKNGYLLTVDVKKGSKTYGEVVHTLPFESPNQINSIYFGKRRNWCCPSRPTEIYLPCIKTGNIYCIDVSKPLEPKEKDRYYPKDILGPLPIVGQQLAEPDHAPSSISRIGTDKLLVSWMSSEFDGRVTIVSKNKFVTNRELAIDNSVSCHAVQNNLLVTCEGPMKKYFLIEFPLDDDLTDVTKTLSPKEFFGNDKHSHYGVHRLTLWDIDRDSDCPVAEVNLRKFGQFPSKVCFLNNDVPEGFVVCSLSGDVIKFVITKHVKRVSRSSFVNIFCGARCSVTQYGFDARKVLAFPPIVMNGWLPNSRLMPAMTSDLVVSSDNSFIVVSNFLHGEIRLYGLPKDCFGFPIPKDELNLGGRGHRGRSEASKDSDEDSVPVVKGKKITGGPARLHLSRDGRRLYVTNSYSSGWDHEFYPTSFEKESFVLLVHIDMTAESGKMLRLDENFMLDFKGSSVGEEFVARCVKSLI